MQCIPNAGRAPPARLPTRPPQPARPKPRPGHRYTTRREEVAEAGRSGTKPYCSRCVSCEVAHAAGHRLAPQVRRPCPRACVTRYLVAAHRISGKGEGRPRARKEIKPRSSPALQNQLRCPRPRSSRRKGPGRKEAFEQFQIHFKVANIAKS